MRKKWMKKTGAAILAAVMAMSVLAGCSGSGTGGGAETSSQSSGGGQTEAGGESQASADTGELKTIRILGIDNSGTDDSGTTVYPQRVPVKPAVFDNEQNSTAQVLAPSISKIERGKELSEIKASYAASNRIIIPLALAKSTHVFN